MEKREILFLSENVQYHKLLVFYAIISNTQLLSTGVLYLPVRPSHNPHIKGLWRGAEFKTVIFRQQVSVLLVDHSPQKSHDIMPGTFQYVYFLRLLSQKLWRLKGAKYAAHVFAKKATIENDRSNKSELYRTLAFSELNRIISKSSNIRSSVLVLKIT